MDNKEPSHNTNADTSERSIRKGTIITGLGTEITKWTFDDFDQVEEFYINNIDRWRLENKVTKVIGTKIFVYSKTNG